MRQEVFSAPFRRLPASEEEETYDPSTRTDFMERRVQAPSLPNPPRLRLRSPWRGGGEGRPPWLQGHSHRLRAGRGNAGLLRQGRLGLCLGHQGASLSATFPGLPGPDQLAVGHSLPVQPELN